MKLANGLPILLILNENANKVAVKWTEKAQVKLKTHDKKNNSEGPSESWRVHSRWIACISVVLRDTNDCNKISEDWYNEWPHHAWVNSPIFQWLRESFLPLPVKEPADYH